MFEGTVREGNGYVCEYNVSFFLSVFLSSCLKVQLSAGGGKCVTCGLIVLSGERADESVGHVCHGVFSLWV